MIAPKIYVHLDVAMVYANAENVFATLDGKANLVENQKNAKARKATFHVLEMVNANMANVSVILVLKVKVVKRKAYAQKTVPNMVFAGKVNANVTQDGLVKHVVNSQTKRIAQKVALHQMVSVTMENVYVPHNTLVQVARPRKNAQITVMDTDNVTYDNACAPLVLKAMRARKTSHATVMAKVLAKLDVAIACQVMKVKAVKLKQNVHKIVLDMVFAVVKLVIVTQDLLVKHVQKM